MSAVGSTEIYRAYGTVALRHPEPPAKAGGYRNIAAHAAPSVYFQESYDLLELWALVVL